MGDSLVKLQIFRKGHFSKAHIWVRRTFAKFSSVTLFDFLKFIFNSLLVFSYTFLGLLAQDWAAKGQITPENKNISALISFVIVGITYIRERFVTSYANNRTKRVELTYECLDGAITKLRNYLIKKKGGKSQYFTDLLHVVESLTFIQLKDFGFIESDFTANLMVYNRKRNGDEKLVLKYRGTCLTGRDGQRTLIIDRNNPSFGAVDAFCRNSVVYLPDITKSPLKEQFGENRPYKSILSIPIPLKSDAKFILNIDSEHPEAFVSEKIVNKVILNTIAPLLNLFIIEKN